MGRRRFWHRCWLGWEKKMSEAVSAGKDLVETFIAAIDNYEPTLVHEYEDAFRSFARSFSRTLDARYLQRHPPEELLPDLEELMAASLQRDPEEVKVRIKPGEGGSNRGVLV